MNVFVSVNDDVSEALWPVKATLGFYIGGMGAKTSTYTELMARMGYEDDAHRIQDLFFEGKRDEAITAAVPEAFADEISLVGPKERIAERLEAWRRTPVTTLLRRRPGRADDAFSPT